MGGGLNSYSGVEEPSRYFWHGKGRDEFLIAKVDAQSKLKEHSVGELGGMILANEGRGPEAQFSSPL